ncbi:hypothetical protein CR513_61905, partial [Mucuna pruriens]
MRLDLKRTISLMLMVKASIKVVEDLRLILEIGDHSDVSKTLYHNHFIDITILCDGLYKLNIDDLYAKTLLTLHFLVNVWVTFLKKD